MLAPENECALIRELTAIRKLLAVIARQRSKLLNPDYMLTKSGKKLKR